MPLLPVLLLLLLPCDGGVGGGGNKCERFWAVWGRWNDVVVGVVYGYAAAGWRIKREIMRWIVSQTQC